MNERQLLVVDHNLDWAGIRAWPLCFSTHMTTHEELVAAVEKHRKYVRQFGSDNRNWVYADRTLMDQCAAILNLHTPSETDDRMCAECPLQSWPCDSVGIVADALRKMGAIDEQ